MQKSSYSALWVLVLFFVGLSGVDFLIGVVRTTEQINEQTVQYTTDATQMGSAINALQSARNERPIEVVLVGDMMFGRGVETSVERNFSGDFGAVLAPMHSVLSNADIAFGNLEGPVSDIGIDGKKMYSFRFDPAVLKVLADAGFDVLAQANNHALDWGRDALCDSVTRIKRAGIAPVGAGCTLSDAERPWITEVRGTRIAFIAYTDFDAWGVATNTEPGLTRFNVASIENTIQTLKKEHDVAVVFVSLHWGDEYQTRSHSTQQALGHTLITAGADVVVGHHPHVPQEIERYADGWIVYSLGNFVFDQAFSKNTMEGLLVRASIRDGHVITLEPTTIVLDDTFVPRSAP